MKTYMDDNIPTYKAMLVAKRYCYQHLDKSIWIMLAKTVYFIYEMCQLNVKIVFLKRKPFGGYLQHPGDFAYNN